MKIAWIGISGFQQFEDTFIDFRHPDPPYAPLDKICLIGKNGTGKTTVLALLDKYFKDQRLNYLTEPGALLLVKIVGTSRTVISGLKNTGGGAFYPIIFSEEIENVPNFFSKLVENSKAYKTLPPTLTPEFEPYRILSIAQKYWDEVGLNDELHDLLIACPSESISNELIEITDVPETNLNSALGLFNNLSVDHTISNETISSFWRLLIYLIKKRESDRAIFEDHPQNQTKTKKQLKDEFEATNPDILKVIADLWNEILSKAGLKFDYEHAKIPIQLTENLHAYIVSKNGERVPYNKLSTGIRNFIFRFGHIKTLYFNREIQKGFLLVDEPENSLFPDFLLNIIEQYEKVTTDKNGKCNTQMFFATHSPIIASQFEPYERIILDWDEDGSVKARKGVSPEGDDPNDILYQDFGMTEIVSKKGQEVWKAYLDLKKKLSRETNDGEKKKIAEKILEIGREYNFG